MYKSTIIILLSLGLIVGCSSQPRLVKAEIPLVMQQVVTVGTKLPTQFRNQLENKSLQSLEHKGYQIEVGPFYVSSLGQECRGLTIYSQQGDKSQRVACTEVKQFPEQVRAWYLIPNIVQSSTSIQL